MFYDFKDESQVKEYLENINTEYTFSCFHEKSAKGCHLLGDFFESVKKDYVNAAAMYKSNCDDQDFYHSCFKFSKYNVSGRGVDKDWKVGMKYALKSCEGDYISGCHLSGLLLNSQEVGSAGDPELAVKHLRKACDADHISSCELLSSWFIAGSNKVAKNMSEAFKYAKKTCDLGHYPGCVNVSVMYKNGQGVSKDEAEASKYEQLARRNFNEVAKSKRRITLNE